MEIASGGSSIEEGVMKFGDTSPFTCPECHGVLSRIEEDRILRFRCHTGHAYSDSALLESLLDHTGDLITEVQRSLHEGVLLLDQMGLDLEQAGDAQRAQAFFAKARELERRSHGFRAAAMEQEILGRESVVLRGPRSTADRNRPADRERGDEERHARRRRESR
jgi:two-component system chemotaxis response regulator CheB